MSHATSFALAALAIVAACRLDPREHDTAQYCCTDLATCMEANGSALHPCPDPMRSFCDNHGQFDGSDEIGRTCVGEPGNRTCDDATDCGDPRAPVCDLAATQTCVDCAGAADCAAFATLPLCHPDRGACVECVAATDCPAERPLCDDDGACVECQRNLQCSSQLCNTVTGTCVPEAEVLYVGQDGTGTMCTRTETCGSVQQAITLATPTRKSIRISSGTYRERITIDNKALYMSSDGGELRPMPGDTGPVVTITGTGVISIVALRIRNAEGAAGDGVDCTGTLTTDVTLRGLLVEDNAGVGVDSSGCRLVVEAATIDQNAAGGVKVVGGDVDLHNSFITRNGSPASAFGGVDVSTPGALAIDFNTIADNVAAPGAAAALQCETTLPRLLSSNLVAGATPGPVSRSNCTMIYTLASEALEGTGNTVAVPLFIDAPMGDYHLAAGSPGIDGADPEPFVTTDVDGEPRVATQRFDVGADEVTP